MGQLSVPGNLSGQERNGGNYDVFPYRHYGYAKAPRNASESSSELQRGNVVAQLHPVAERVLRPRYVCIIGENGTTIMNVRHWEREHPGEALDYVFIAYTAEQFSHDSGDDMEALHAIAKRATEDAGLRAYWVGASCMPDDEMEQDVYRINDVIRGAQSLVIALGSNEATDPKSNEQLLRQWGSRMWTYPEVLLSPGEAIKVFFRNDDRVQKIPKRQFAATAWDDARVSRQLIDHYEGSLTLSRLELVTLALICLHSRQTSR